jgi:hypothetical protein
MLDDGVTKAPAVPSSQVYEAVLRRELVIRSETEAALEQVEREKHK